MDNDFTVNAAIIAAIAAIIAPTISALIHSVKEYKIAKMSCTISTRIDCCSKFSYAYSSCQYGSEKTGYMKTFYQESMKLIPLCHKRTTRQLLFKLANQVISHGASTETDKLYEKCIRSLAKEF